MSFLLGDLVDLTGEEVDAEKSLVQEYEMFVRETAVKGNADPLDWWKNKADSYKKNWRLLQSFFFVYPARPFPQSASSRILGILLRKREQVWTPTQLINWYS